jgi:hypothetical protein
MVVLDLIAAQVLLHLGDVGLQAEAGHILQPDRLRLVPVAVAVELVKGLGQLLDVIAVVGIFRQGEVLLSTRSCI